MHALRQVDSTTAARLPRPPSATGREGLPTLSEGAMDEDDASFPRSSARINLSDLGTSSPVTATASVANDADADDDDWAPRRQARQPRPRHAHRHRRRPQARAPVPLQPYAPAAAAVAGAGGAATGRGAGAGAGAPQAHGGDDSPSSAVMPSIRRVSISATTDYDGDTSDWLTDYSEAPGGRYTAVLEQLVKVDSCQACKGPVDANGASHVAVEVGKVDAGGVARGPGAGLTEDEKAEKKRKAKVKDYMKTALSSGKMSAR